MSLIFISLKFGLPISDSQLWIAILKMGLSRNVHSCAVISRGRQVVIFRELNWANVKRGAINTPNRAVLDAPVTPTKSSSEKPQNILPTNELFSEVVLGPFRNWKRHGLNVFIRKVYSGEGLKWNIGLKTHALPTKWPLHQTRTR